MFDVLCVGNALVDITIKVPDSFLVGANLKKGAMTLTDDVSQKFLLSSISGMPSSLSSGGSASNVALGVACLGGKSSFIGKVGLDANGSFFEESLTSRGVVPHLSKDISLNTGTVIAFITDDGERSFSTYLGASDSFDKASFLNVPSSKFLHVEAFLLEKPSVKNLIFDLAMNAKKNGSKISFDLSDASLIGRIKPVISEFLEFVDVVFANESEAKAFTGVDGLDAARILSESCEIAIVKFGEGGSVVVSGDVEEVIEVDVVIPVNTNGAGDAYAAGFLFGLSRNLDLKDSAGIASFLAKETVLVEEASVQKSLKVKVAQFLD
jgi:sugar/nucleoside kinase (ribokinase family)